MAGTLLLEGLQARALTTEENSRLGEAADPLAGEDARLEADGADPAQVLAAGRGVYPEFGAPHLAEVEAAPLAQGLSVAEAQ